MTFDLKIVRSHPRADDFLYKGISKVGDDAPSNGNRHKTFACSVDAIALFVSSVKMTAAHHKSENLLGTGSFVC